MEFRDLINTRESVRNYNPGKPVPQDVIHRILEAGRLAPSACNYQPYKFLVVSSQEMLQKVKTCYKRPWFQDAPHILVITGARTQAWTRSYDGYNSIETDMAIAMTYIVLAAANEGVGTCWIEAYDPALLRQSLNIGPETEIFGITPLGYRMASAEITNTKKRKTFEDIVEFI
jgi:nitroreductase